MFWQASCKDPTPEGLMLKKKLLIAILVARFRVRI
jgi:hypothetical protein